MKNNQKIVNIGFFKKVWYSITKFEKYPEMATEGFGRALKYLIILSAFVTLCMTIGSTISMRNVVFQLADYVQNNIPEFTYEDGNIQMDVTEPIFIEEVAYDGIDRIIINPLIEDKEEKVLFREQNSQNGITIFFFKNQIVIQTVTDDIEASVSPYTYQDFIKSYTGEDIKSFNKAQLVEFMRGSGMNSFYINYSVSAFLTFLVAEIIVMAINALEIAVFGWLTTVITRIKIRFVAIYNMSVYALTLPTILNMIYITINIFTTFIISYFQVAYITIAYVYLVTVIFLLKDDLIKRLQEVEKIKKEQEKVRQEIKEQEEKEPTVEPREPVEKDRKEDNEDKKEKNDNNGEETNGSEA